MIKNLYLFGAIVLKLMPSSFVFSDNLNDENMRKDVLSAQSEESFYEIVDCERKWLTEVYLPSLEGRILFVGVDTYNSEYYKCVKNPELFETMDILPEQARYGSPYVHHTGDFLLFNPGYQYDHICLFGMIGRHNADNITGEYNINSKAKIVEALCHADGLLKVGGTLQIGPEVRTNIAAKKNLQDLNKSFWMTQFTLYPLDHFEPIFRGYGTYNMVWLGKKVK